MPRVWPHQHRHNPPIVLVDLDGVLADMSAFADLLVPDEGFVGKRWKRFFRHAGEATLIDTGAELVTALDRVGVRVQYSTSRPSFATGASIDWLQAQDLPQGRLYARSGDHPRLPIPSRGPAIEVKLAHCALVDDRHGLAGFVDDEPDVVDALRAAGYPAWLVGDLADATTGQLRELTRHRTMAAAGHGFPS